jgi:hypothetical protein
MNLKLDEICKSWLDHADMTIDFSRYPAIRLDMVVRGSIEGRFWQVVFEIEQVLLFTASPDANTHCDNFFMVLDVKARQVALRDIDPAKRPWVYDAPSDDTVWEISIWGDLPLEIVAHSLKWHTVELTYDEYLATYD